MGLFRTPVRDVLASLEQLAALRSPWRALVLPLLAMVVTWFVYVPIHELLHVAGCVLTGGEVTRLELSPQYGAAWLAKVFPFIVSGSDYAGRLSGFDTKGSDLVYLATDFAPFLLTVLIGVPLLRLCTRRCRPLLLGVAVVVGLAPFYNIPGDYYEMGSIVATRVVSVLAGQGHPPLFEGIRFDDVYLLLERLVLRPEELGLTTGAQLLFGAVLILGSLIINVLLAFLTYYAGAKVADRLVGRPTLRATSTRQGPRGPAGSPAH